MIVSSHGVQTLEVARVQFLDCKKKKKDSNKNKHERFEKAHFVRIGFSNLSSDGSKNSLTSLGVFSPSV
jgi:hypothetical protein